MTLQVEIGQYRPMQKGALVAFFTLAIYPAGEKIIDCKHMTSNQGDWWALPSKEVKKDGLKSDYIPIVSYAKDGPYWAELNEKVLIALKAMKEKEHAPKEDFNRAW